MAGNQSSLGKLVAEVWRFLDDVEPETDDVLYARAVMAMRRLDHLVGAVGSERVCTGCHQPFAVRPHEVGWLLMRPEGKQLSLPRRCPECRRRQRRSASKTEGVS